AMPPAPRSALVRLYAARGAVQAGLPRRCCADPAPSGIYTLSLHDALPIFLELRCSHFLFPFRNGLGHTIRRRGPGRNQSPFRARSEEHTSELQSRENLVCRLLLEKKNRVGRFSREGAARARGHSGITAGTR